MLVNRVVTQFSQVIVGQDYLIERLLIGLLANGHVLLEGVPGLAKTLAVRTLAASIAARFQRLQFTPDLLPADLLGTQIYNPQTGEFSTRKGPIFANIILADEINRAPAKVQSALLEAMQERQVTIGDQTFPLEEPFLVLATQNPIEQEGTYSLPEAQLDRFMLKLKVGYPSKEEEKKILEKQAKTNPQFQLKPVIKPSDILEARALVDEIYVDNKVKDYIVDIIFATREPEEYGLSSLEEYIEWGASPRASICLTLASKAHAFIKGRGYVTPHDVKSIGWDVLRHRIMLTYEAEADEITVDDVIDTIFDEVPVP
ncbi:MAG: MoxR family ATPase [Limnochordia bacterium]|nr:AAA family ATPase [Limnochordia bacterium]MDD2630568.1 MoxR family ATPase [Limnochordia bacterium]